MSNPADDPDYNPRIGGLHMNRKCGESFSLFVHGLEIKVVLLSTKGRTAKFSIYADRDHVAIRRDEQLINDKEGL